MIVGFVLIGLGYPVFYWGLHHMPQYKDTRYSLWTLLGMTTMMPNGKVIPGTLFKSGKTSQNPFMVKAGIPVEIKTK